MPFSKTKEHHTEDYWKRHFNAYLKPLIEKNDKLEAFRSEPLRGDIASQIITDLTNDEIVVADLTDHNPNVLWELGVRQSFRNCTITIAEIGTTIPFHFNRKGILFYNGEHLDNDTFETQFQKALNDCLELPNEPDSPVLVALGGRGTLYSIMHIEENTRRLNAVRSEMAYNEERMKSILNCCDQNSALRSQNKESECRMMMLTFRTIAIENLSVNRYLDLMESTYDLISAYYSYIQALSSLQENWSKNASGAEEQFRAIGKLLFELNEQINRNFIFLLNKPLPSSNVGTI